MEGRKPRSATCVQSAYCRYWNDKSEEKILRTTTNGQKWHDLIYVDSPEFLFFLLIFNFLKNLVKCFILIHIVFAFYSFEKFSLIHDRHTSISHFYTKFQLIFYTKPNFRCFLVFFQNKNSNSIHLLKHLLK